MYTILQLDLFINECTRLSKLDDFMNQLYQIYMTVQKEGVAQVF
jgi:predicted metalloprotease with PDZ domain